MPATPPSNSGFILKKNSGHPELLTVPQPYFTTPRRPPPSSEVPTTSTNSRTIPETLSRTTALKLQPIILLRKLPPPMSPEVIGTDSPQVSDDSQDSDNSTIGAVPIAQDGVEAGGGDPEDVPRKIQVTPLRLGQILLEEPNEDVRIKVTRTLTLPVKKRKLECLHEGCGKIYFGGKWNFKYHILDKHGGILPIQCPLCTTYSAIILPEIYNHFHNVHKKTMFICPLCDLHLPTTYKVSAHYKRVHGIWVGQNETNTTFEEPEPTQKDQVVQTPKAPENLEEAKEDKKKVVEDSKKQNDQNRVLEDSDELSKVQNVEKRVKLVENVSKNLPEAESEVKEVEEEDPEVQIIKIVPPPGRNQVQDSSKELGDAKDNLKKVVEDSNELKNNQKRGPEDSGELSNVQNVVKVVNLVENKSKNQPEDESEVEEMEEEEPEVQIIKVVPAPCGDKVQDKPNDLEEAKDAKKRVVEDAKKLSNVQKRVKLVDYEIDTDEDEDEMEEEEEPEVQIIKVVPPQSGDQIQDDLEDPEVKESTIQELIAWLEGEMADAENPLRFKRQFANARI